ncbi:MAG: hypothetical protein JOY78_20405 [Pseudonocardia sp.]|nr:hypothetical protein [Pseudonocardia sp.]
MNLGMTVLVLVIYVLVVMRLTRLINSDTILDAPRVALARVFGPDSTAVYFFNCPWCVSMWVGLGLGIIPVHLVGWPWWALIPVALSASQIIGMCAPLYQDEEIEFEPAPEPTPPS